MEIDKQATRKRKLGFEDCRDSAKKMEMTTTSVNNEDEEEKVLCVEILCKDGKERWFAIDDPKSTDCSKARLIVEINTMTPGKFHAEIGLCATARLGHFIFYIGGARLPLDLNYHSPVYDVSIYDTKLGTWFKGPSLNYRRAFPMPVTVSDRIYVFGSLPRNEGILINSDVGLDNWVECYHQHTWKTISGPKDAPKESHFSSDQFNFAVVHFRNDIRFLANDGSLYVFDTDTDTWNPTRQFPHHKITSFNFFNDNHAVYGDFAFWHWFGKVYAWDLTTNQTSQIGTFQDPFPCPNSEPYTSSFLHLGNGVMCIVYWIRARYQSYVACYTFKIEGRPFSSDLPCHVSIGPAPLSTFVIPGASSIGDAFALSSQSSAIYSGCLPLES